MRYRGTVVVAVAAAAGLGLSQVAAARNIDPASAGAYLIERGFLPGVWGGSASNLARVSRYDAAWILAAFLDPADHAFMVTAWADVPPGFWALSAVNRVTARDLMEADGANFSGTSAISRGAFMVALDKVLRLRAAPLPAPPERRLVLTDIKGFSGQDALQRAANDWLLLDRGGAFRPQEYLTRQDAVSWVYKAAALVDPGVAARLLAYQRPSPTPVPSETESLLPTPGPGSTMAPPPTPVPTPRFSPTPGPSVTSLPRPTPAPRSTPAWSPRETPPPWLIMPSWDPTPVVALPTPSPVPTAVAPLPTPVPQDKPQGVSASSRPVWRLPSLDWSRRQGAAWVVSGLAVGAGDGRTFRDLSFYLPGSVDAGLSLEVPGWALEARALGRWFPGAAAGLVQSEVSADAFWLPQAAASVRSGVGLGLQLGLQVPTGTTDPEAGRTFVGAGPSAVVRMPLGPLQAWALARSQVGLALSTSVGPGFGIGGELGARWPSPLGLPVDPVLSWRLQGVLRSSGSQDWVQGVGLGVGRSF